MRTGACLWVQVRILEPGVPVTSQLLLTAGALFSSMGSTPGWISPDLESQEARVLGRFGQREAKNCQKKEGSSSGITQN